MAGCVISVAAHNREGKSYWFSPSGLLEGQAVSMTLSAG